MANGRQATVKRLNMAERAQQQMDLHFPGTDPRFMWHRKRNDGFTTIPRTMPIVMQAVDEASKGTPPGHVLFCLWARSPDNPLLTIENPATFAAEAGFSGERIVDTWRKRMKKLRDHGMILTKKGATGEFHHVLLLNPNTGVETMRTHRNVSDDLYGRFIDRMAEVGAYGEIEGIREFRAEQAAAAAAVKTAAAEAGPKNTPAVTKPRKRSKVKIQKKEDLI
jgi:hypothetical protein